MKKVYIAIIFVILFMCACAFLYYDKSSKLALKCSITGKYTHVGNSLRDCYYGTTDPSEEYFLINLRNKTINDYNWKPVDTFKNVEIGDKSIEMTEIMTDDSELNYIIYRNTGEVLGVRKVEDKKDHTETLYTYEGTCEPYDFIKKF